MSHQDINQVCDALEETVSLAGDVRQQVTDLTQTLEACEHSMRSLVASSSQLEQQRRRVSTQREVLAAFLKQFYLNSDEEKAWSAVVEAGGKQKRSSQHKGTMTFDFLYVLDRMDQVLHQCAELMAFTVSLRSSRRIRSAGDASVEEQTGDVGLEIMRTVSARRETGRLLVYQWVVRVLTALGQLSSGGEDAREGLRVSPADRQLLRTLGTLDATQKPTFVAEPPRLLLESMRVLLPSRTFLSITVAQYARWRSVCTLSAFLHVLSDTASRDQQGGVSDRSWGRRAIRQPTRYVSDMLAWFHQTLASERDHLCAVFALQSAQVSNGKNAQRDQQMDVYRFVLQHAGVLCGVEQQKLQGSQSDMNGKEATHTTPTPTSLSDDGHNTALPWFADLCTPSQSEASRPSDTASQTHVPDGESKSDDTPSADMEYAAGDVQRWVFERFLLHFFRARLLEQTLERIVGEGLLAAVERRVVTVLETHSDDIAVLSRVLQACLFYGQMYSQTLYGNVGGGLGGGEFLAKVSAQASCLTDLERVPHPLSAPLWSKCISRAAAALKRPVYRKVGLLQLPRQASAVLTVFRGLAVRCRAALLRCAHQRITQQLAGWLGSAVVPGSEDTGSGAQSGADGLIGVIRSESGDEQKKERKPGAEGVLDLDVAMYLLPVHSSEAKHRTLSRDDVTYLLRKGSVCLGMLRQALEVSRTVLSAYKTAGVVREHDEWSQLWLRGRTSDPSPPRETHTLVCNLDHWNSPSAALFAGFARPFLAMLGRCWRVVVRSSAARRTPQDSLACRGSLEVMRCAYMRQWLGHQSQPPAGELWSAVSDGNWLLRGGFSDRLTANLSILTVQALSVMLEAVSAMHPPSQERHTATPYLWSRVSGGGRWDQQDGDLAVLDRLVHRAVFGVPALVGGDAPVERKQDGVSEPSGSSLRWFSDELEAVPTCLALTAHVQSLVRAVAVQLRYLVRRDLLAWLRREMVAALGQSQEVAVERWLLATLFDQSPSLTSHPQEWVSVALRLVHEHTTSLPSLPASLKLRDSLAVVGAVCQPVALHMLLGWYGTLLRLWEGSSSQWNVLDVVCSEAGVARPYDW